MQLNIQRSGGNLSPLRFLVFPAVLALGFLHFAAASAQSETVAESSIEWLTVRSSVVAIGLVDFIKTTERTAGRPIDEWTLTVTKPYKGTPGEKISFFVTRPVGVTDPKLMFDQTSEFVVFLISARGEGFDPLLSGRMVPVTSESPLSIFDIEKPITKLFELSGKRIESREQLLSSIEQTNKAYEEYLHSFSPKVKRHYLEMKAESEAYKDLYSGSAVYLIVPNFLSKDSKESL